MRAFLLPIFLASVFSASAQIDTLNHVLGKIDYSKDSEFVIIPEAYASRSGMFLRKEAFEAFKKMHDKALKEGVNLKIVSAARNFNHQKRIWEAKWNGIRKVSGLRLNEAIPDPAKRAKKILLYSSMPGTSRHHWGTDIDINSVNPNYFETKEGIKEYRWLRSNAQLYGFCQVYSEKGADRTDGYEEEKWHWSYVPIAAKFTQYYVKHVPAKDVSGFDGSDALPFTETLKYVEGISKRCQ